jgi:hypothetical protein
MTRLARSKGTRLAFYKVLGAANTLGQFTVADLIRYADVTKEAVSQVISRNKDLFTEIGQINQIDRKRGRPVKRLKLSDQHRDEVNRILGELYEDLRKLIPVEPPPEEEDRDQLELLLAEEILLDRLPAVVDIDERSELLKIAKRHFETDAERIRRSPEHDHHRRLVDALLEFTMLDLQVRQGVSVYCLMPSLAMALQRIRSVCRQLSVDLQENVAFWLRQNPLLARLPWKVEQPVPARAQSAGGRTTIPVGKNFPLLPQMVAGPLGMPLSAYEFDWSPLLGVNLIRMDETDDDEAFLVEHVCKEMRVLQPVTADSVLKVGEPQSGGLSLIAINSGGRASVDPALKLVHVLRKKTHDVCVLDVAEQGKFREQLYLDGAQYVGNAVQISRDELLTAVAPLRYAEGARNWYYLR